MKTVNPVCATSKLACFGASIGHYLKYSDLSMVAWVGYARTVNIFTPVKKLI
jgi:hypothetical protein